MGDPLTRTTGLTRRLRWAGRLIWPLVMGLSSVHVFATEPLGLEKAETFLTRSREVFVGRMLSEESYLSADGGAILTRYVFQVEEQIKGSSRGRIEIVEYGGTVGDLTLYVSHSARYRSGETYLVFCYEDELKRNRTLAGSLGQLPVFADPSGQRKVRVSPAHPLWSLIGAEPLSLFRDLQSVSGNLRHAIDRAGYETK